MVLTESFEGGEFAEDAGAEEVAVYSRAREGAGLGLKEVGSLINSAGSFVLSVSPCVGTQFS